MSNMLSILSFGCWTSENSHRLHENEIVKMFVSGLKTEVFLEEMYSRAFETLVDVMAETRHELANYRDFIKISERIKRPEPKKDAKDRSADGPISRKEKRFARKTPSGASFAKVSSTGKIMNLKDVECFKCHKKRNYANKCPNAKG